MQDLHGILFAYTSGEQLRELTEHRTESSVPFGGRYRVVDFMLSNLVNAGVRDVGVIMQENYQSLLDHLGSGKDWDLSRKRGGLRLLPPFGYAGSNRGLYRGNLDALAAAADYISYIRQKYVVLADANVIANLPLEEIFRRHVDAKAAVTCVCAPCHEGREERAYFRLGEKDTVTETLAGNPEPDTYADMGVYILSKSFLEDLLRHCGTQGGHDFAFDILQQKQAGLHIMGYLHSGYRACLRTVSDYYRESMQLLCPEIRGDLFSRARPVKTKVRDEASSYYGANSHVRNCVVADGCFLEGDIENSIIFRGVRVEPGAVIRDSILMQGTQVLRNAKVSCVITDKNVVINPDRTLTGHPSCPAAVSKGKAV